MHLARWPSRLETAFNDTVEQVRSALAAEVQPVLVLRLTLVLVILHGATSPFASFIIRIVGSIMLVVPGLVGRAKVLWWLLVASLAISNIDQWQLIDNHQYLLMYWVAVCSLSIGRADWLCLNARALVAIAFTFAALWKVLAGQYADGGFFYYTLFTDGRVKDLAARLADGGALIVAQTSEALM